MRGLVVLAMLMSMTNAVRAQVPAAPTPDRYGVALNRTGYPQDTPTAAVESVIKAIDRGKFDYLAAQLLNPTLIDQRVQKRAAVIRPLIDRELRLLRDVQRTTPGGSRLPLDPVGFAEFVEAQAVSRAFQDVVTVIRNHLAAHPQTVRELRNRIRGVEASLADNQATFPARDRLGEPLRLTLIADRWHAEDQPRPEPMQQNQPQNR